MAPSFDDPCFISRATNTPSSKRRNLMEEHHYHRHQPLLPGLPDHVAQLCLNLVPPSTLYSVCHSWRRVIYTPDFPPFLSLYTLSFPTTTTSSGDHDSTLQLSSFDPISSKWSIVTPSPPDLRRVCLRHPSFIARNFPMQSLSVAGNLILLAGTSKNLLPAYPHPLIFNPRSKTWSSGPPLSASRRWCAAGVSRAAAGDSRAAGISRAAVIIASGIGSHFTQTVARSVEKWVFRETDLFDEKVQDSTWVWKKMRSLCDVKFSREAIDSVGCKGKLYMVDVKANEGVFYDVNSDEWWPMAEGLLGGWRGPAAAMEDETIYVVDELKGVLRKYDDAVEEWVDVVADEMLKGAERIAAGGGRVCVLRGGGVGIVVVDVVASPPRLVVVETPPGRQVVGIHILPRMCPPEVESSVYKSARDMI